MKIVKEFREKSIEKLNLELQSLRREQFNLNLQAASGQLKEFHLLKEVRRNIARIKTLLTEKTLGGGVCED